ncbi:MULTISPECIES: DUF1289 domain-containing protein [Uliginosibacterium]|jgi:predicted Fe-S protein YdhL (DUF1289 family)|uniref:DUF1289 domain-containing protein n=1 Tax=Uliginosibacterium aquaticum TaxID=2731212 RepID=A0ABX2IGR5_9RHOO|nr:MULTISPECIES: DUF1289 domain-containing protein [Uliginosibacterium]MDO6387241.1 DUF1289 domain-containing protein [Uliginosibacterium sp. 31-12]NSL55996.1 DUF1289 domain-containing protein [Uliginosibacterium aquaticum]PLK50744.1 DUF1289 domain-containing protein [Uliginosibacterium sp. TH139]
MAAELPASPCVRECCLDGRTDTCVGCFRTLDEITGWHAADAAEREQILARCAERRVAYQTIHQALRR